MVAKLSIELMESAFAQFRIALHQERAKRALAQRSLAPGLIELGPRGEGAWPCHDLLAVWTLLDRQCCTWVDAPLAVDTGRSAAWGATIVDRRGRHAGEWPVWSVAMRVDGARHRDGVRAWLRGDV